MQHLLIVESQSPLSGPVSGITMALEAARSGVKVCLWLMQDGTQMLQTRPDTTFQTVCRHDHIEVFADDFALTQRGISMEGWNNVTAAGIDVFTETLLDPAIRPIWH